MNYVVLTSTCSWLHRVHPTCFERNRVDTICCRASRQNAIGHRCWKVGATCRLPAGVYWLSGPPAASCTPGIYQYRISVIWASMKARATCCPPAASRNPSIYRPQTAAIGLPWRNFDTKFSRGFVLAYYNPDREFAGFSPVIIINPETSLYNLISSPSSASNWILYVHESRLLRCNSLCGLLGPKT